MCVWVCVRSGSGVCVDVRSGRWCVCMGVRSGGMCLCEVGGGECMCVCGVGVAKIIGDSAWVTVCVCV